MEGKNLMGAGVGAESSTFNAVSLARWILENTNHVLMTGPDTREAAKAAGLPVKRLTPSGEAARRYARLSSSPKGKQAENVALLRRFHGGDTVGAVAIDSRGVPAAAVSTGGLWLKLPGRVGDSAILGAGIYADVKAGAACATGTGEEIIRRVLSWQACQMMKQSQAQEAARRAIRVMTRGCGEGTAGIITVDRRGGLGSAYNTEAMGRAWFDSSKGRTIVRV
jgi:beta-aspartyl-peptidase (threonine type)